MVENCWAKIDKKGRKGAERMIKIADLRKTQGILDHCFLHEGFEDTLGFRRKDHTATYNKLK